MAAGTVWIGGPGVMKGEDLAAEDFSLQFNVEVAKGQKINVKALGGVHVLLDALVEGRPIGREPHEPLRMWFQDTVPSNRPLSPAAPSPTKCPAEGPNVQ